MKRESLPGGELSHRACNTGNYQRFQIRLRFVLAQTALKMNRLRKLPGVCLFR
jgi:hypothetical protein